MEEKRRPGRPKGQGKPPGEKWLGLMVRMPPEMFARFRAAVPMGERAEFVRQCIERGLQEKANPAQETSP